MAPLADHGTTDLGGETMGRHTTFATLIALVMMVPATAGASEAIPGANGTIFVTERQLGSVAALDAATGATIWTRAVGATPIGVTQPRGTDKVYTSDEGPDQVSVLDASSGTPLVTIPMGPDPHHLMASANGRRLYVAEFGWNRIGVIDTGTDERIAAYVANPLATARTHAVWITNDTQDLYATNTRVDRTMRGDVAHLDARTGELLCNTEVGADPSEILVAPSGKLGYVTVRRENIVKELDLRGRCPRLTGREALVGTQPDTLQLTNDGQTLVVALRGTPAAITLLDTSTFETRSVSIPGHVTTGHHALSADGKFTFVAVESPGAVAVIDNATGSVVDVYDYPTGGTRPHGVFFGPSRAAGGG
jgi:DNA-binding beta-propeller fold protein YncE